MNFDSCNDNVVLCFGKSDHNCECNPVYSIHRDGVDPCQVGSTYLYVDSNYYFNWGLANSDSCKLTFTLPDGILWDFRNEIYWPNLSHTVTITITGKPYTETGISYLGTTLDLNGIPVQQVTCVEYDYFTVEA